MSAPKLKRRIGFTIDTQGRLRTTARGGKWTPDLVREARWLYLTVLAGECPEVLKSLSRLQYSDIAALDAWLASWGLVSADSADDWCREHAMATRRNWARYQPRPLYWFDREDLGGTLYDDTEPPEARPLKHIDHFVWLAQHQSGAPRAKAATRRSIREAVATLADRLGLQLRTTARGSAPSQKLTLGV